MNSVFKHLTLHPQHGLVLIQPIALSDLGTSESEVMKHRKAGRLIESVHFVRIPVQGMARLHWTIKGLVDLSIVLSTDRAAQFRDGLAEWLKAQNPSAIQPAASSSITPLSPDPSSITTTEPDPPPIAAENSIPDFQVLQPASAQSVPPPQLNADVTPRQSGNAETPSLKELQRIQQIAELQRDTATLHLVDQIIGLKTVPQPAAHRISERVTERIETHSRTLILLGGDGVLAGLLCLLCSLLFLWAGFSLRSPQPLQYQSPPSRSF